jgi:hypothetical protein
MPPWAIWFDHALVRMLIRAAPETLTWVKNFMKSLVEPTAARAAASQSNVCKKSEFDHLRAARCYLAI